MWQNPGIESDNYTPLFVEVLESWNHSVLLFATTATVSIWYESAMDKNILRIGVSEKNVFTNES